MSDELVQRSRHLPADQPSWRRRAIETLAGAERADLFAERLGRSASSRILQLSNDGRRSTRCLRELRNRYANERCVIIGNGPSLNQTNLTLLRDEYTFGLNRQYLMYDRISFRCTFHIAVNQLVVEQFAKELLEVPGELFTTWSNRSFFAGSVKPIYLSGLTRPMFSRNAIHGVWEGATVTNVALQLAYHFGFRQVLLVGVDHRFTNTGTPHTVVHSKGSDADHFDPTYFGKGTRWQLPDLAGSEQSFALAREAFDSAGRQVLDCTVNGALQVFPKCSLARALASA